MDRRNIRIARSLVRLARELIGYNVADAINDYKKNAAWPLNDEISTIESLLKKFIDYNELNDNKKLEENIIDEITEKGNEFKKMLDIVKAAYVKYDHDVLGYKGVMKNTRYVNGGNYPSAPAIADYVKENGAKTDSNGLSERFPRYSEALAGGQGRHINDALFVRTYVGQLEDCVEKCGEFRKALEEAKKIADGMVLRLEACKGTYKKKIGSFTEITRALEAIQKRLERCIGTFSENAKTGLTFYGEISSSLKEIKQQTGE